MRIRGNAADKLDTGKERRIHKKKYYTHNYDHVHTHTQDNKMKQNHRASIATIASYLLLNSHKADF